jgi:chemosensory pili system protein ChpC
MSDLRDELYSLLVPLAGERLIVPRACVAEVIGYQTPAAMTNAPPWYAGLVTWSGRNVPVVSFEGAFGQPLPSVSTRTRIVIFHANGGALQAGFFGMLTQGFPQLVRMVNETPLIPDLQRLEQMIAEETSVMPQPA